MKKTDGERIAQKGWDMPAQKPSDTIANIARLIDRLVARRQAEAWDECCEAWIVPSLSSRDFVDRAIRSNPYRKGGKR